ncbi:erythromycin esterase family protein [Methanosarcina acetivorans]|uniref:erythromycin esterase family protein n=1 Tax=Methanosarcina acetivorans TaxID=2214 RepID=UPI00200A9490|nr:erythromycin esterase family protein [Methanosarcina acetivorans]
MRLYHADPSNLVKLLFYGFDSPTEMTGTDSPRRVLYFVLDYLASIDNASSQEHRKCIDQLLGQDFDWENPAAMMDPTKSTGLSPAATALRIETENLISELHVRRPELVAKSDKLRYLEAVHYATVSRQLLNCHAVMARTTGKPGYRLVSGLGLRDAMMAANLE